MPNLVGIGNSQVPTNAMLGGLAYQDSVGEIVIDKIKAKTGDTAVDIFVYDTRKDSDGGAWRHRTQNKSWYNEGVSRYRGARKEFPAVAVLVLEGNVFTIYDGDDPNLPMWMIFNKGSNTYFQVTTNKCVTALNGKIVSGGNVSNDRLRVIDFLLDNEVEFSHSDGRRTTLSPISDRNGSTTFGSYDSSLPGIVNRYVNAVAMTVQPNAPIDSATGLPIPTIAVGTAGGLSVIRDDGTVFDYTGFNPVTFVAIEKDVVVGALGGTSTHDFIFKTNLLNKDEAFNARILSGTGNYYMNSNSGTTPLMRDLNMTAMTFNPSDTTIYRGGNSGFDIITETDTVSGTVNNSLIAYVDTDYNSGYMVGDIRGAFLSDTDTTNISSSNLMSGATYNTSARIDSYSYTNGSSTLVINDQQSSADGYVNLTLGGLTALTNYVVTVTGNQSYTPTSGYNHHLGNTSDGTIYFEDNFVGTTTPQSLTFKTPSSGNPTIVLYSGYNGALTYTLDLRLAEFDRSLGSYSAYNSAQNATIGQKDGIGIYGTITKSPVATGAELVAYSGFSNSNYLLQPYTSDLDFTDTMSIVLWVKGWVGSDSLLHRGPGTDRNQKTSFHLYCSYDHNYRLTLCSTTLNNSGNTIEQTFEIPLSGSLTGWQHLCFTLSDGLVRGFLNGEEKTLSSNSFTGTNIFSQATHQNGLWIGTGPVSGPATTASLALLRLSASVPSAEQVKKIYNDEKHLFQKNAKCTISGATSAVTALGFDDSTSTLHVGTSSGRSDFRGLNRINNTTTAVTTAISASNGLVAEQ